MVNGLSLTDTPHPRPEVPNTLKYYFSNTLLCWYTLLGFQRNPLKFKGAVGMDNHSWGAGNVSQINHPRCEQNFQVGFLHILFLWVSLKLKSLFIWNILALESFFFPKYSLIAHNPFILFHFPAIPPLTRLSKANCAQTQLQALLLLEFCLPQCWKNPALQRLRGFFKDFIPFSIL